MQLYVLNGFILIIIIIIGVFIILTINAITIKIIQIRIIEYAKIIKVKKTDSNLGSTKLVNSFVKKFIKFMTIGVINFIEVVIITI